MRTPTRSPSRAITTPAANWLSIPTSPGRIYLGGSLADYGYGISLDAAGNAYVTGQTASTNFSGANNSSLGGSYDAFVAKVSAAGTLAWMTYLGGSNNDYGKGIFVDPAGNAYITGQTNSGNFSGANNSYKGGAYDAFAAKISTAGRSSGQPTSAETRKTSAWASPPTPTATPISRAIPIP